MSDLRQAAQRALDALEGGADSWQRVGPAIDALRAALAEPVQEPVAWIQPDHLQKARQAPFLCRVEPTKRMVDFVALYIAPPQRPAEPVQEPVAQQALNALVMMRDRYSEDNCPACDHADAAIKALRGQP